jgi:hypothetical protein
VTSLLILAVLLSGAPAAEGEAAPAKPDPAAAVEGRLPDEPARAVLQARCLICHTVDYVTQQRLTAGQWLKTVEKMRKFGAPLTDDEVKPLADYLGRHWTVDLPERRPAPVPPPAGSVPSR